MVSSSLRSIRNRGRECVGGRVGTVLLLVLVVVAPQLMAGGDQDDTPWVFREKLVWDNEWGRPDDPYEALDGIIYKRHEYYEMCRAVARDRSSDHFWRYLPRYAPDPSWRDQYVYTREGNSKVPMVEHNKRVWEVFHYRRRSKEEIGRAQTELLVRATKRKEGVPGQHGVMLVRVSGYCLQGYPLAAFESKIAEAGAKEWVSGVLSSPHGGDDGFRDHSLAERAVRHVGWPLSELVKRDPAMEEDTITRLAATDEQADVDRLVAKITPGPLSPGGRACLLKLVREEPASPGLQAALTALAPDSSEESIKFIIEALGNKSVRYPQSLVSKVLKQVRNHHGPAVMNSVLDLIEAKPEFTGTGIPAIANFGKRPEVKEAFLEIMRDGNEKELLVLAKYVDWEDEELRNMALSLLKRQDLAEKARVGLIVVWAPRVKDTPGFGGLLWRVLTDDAEATTVRRAALAALRSSLSAEDKSTLKDILAFPTLPAELKADLERAIVEEPSDKERDTLKLKKYREHIIGSVAVLEDAAKLDAESRARLEHLRKELARVDKLIASEPVEEPPEALDQETVLEYFLLRLWSIPGVLEAEDEDRRAEMAAEVARLEKRHSSLKKRIVPVRVKCRCEAVKTWEPYAGTRLPVRILTEQKEILEKVELPLSEAGELAAVALADGFVAITVKSVPGFPFAGEGEWPVAKGSDDAPILMLKMELVQEEPEGK